MTVDNAGARPERQQLYRRHTIYVAPSALGLSSHVQVYQMPYPMRDGQRPSDIRSDFQREWKQVGTIKVEVDRLHVVALDREFQQYKGLIEDLYVGGFFEIEVPVVEREPGAAAHESPRLGASDVGCEP